MTATHKRLIALAVLAIGLAPSIPINFANALVPNQEDLQRHCRDRLGFGSNEPLYGPQLLQLRRCIDNTKKQFEHAERLLLRSGAVQHVQYAIPKQRGPEVRETQRSLKQRMENNKISRITYYQNVPVQEREVLLQDHRRSRRIQVQKAEPHLLRQRRDEYLRWKQTIQPCRYTASQYRQNCQ